MTLEDGENRPLKRKDGGFMGKYAFGVDVGGTTVKLGLFD